MYYPSIAAFLIPASPCIQGHRASCHGKVTPWTSCLFIGPLCLCCIYIYIYDSLSVFVTRRKSHTSRCSSLEGFCRLKRPNVWSQSQLCVSFCSQNTLVSTTILSAAILNNVQRFHFIPSSFHHRHLCPWYGPKGVVRSQDRLVVHDGLRRHDGNAPHLMTHLRRELLRRKKKGK